MRLIPINQEAEDQLKTEMKRKIFLDNVEQFINSYNQGLLSKGNDKVKEVGEAIRDTYRNVEYSQRYITVLSEEETALSGIEELIGYWKFIAALKSLATQMVEEGYDYEDRIIFTEENRGYPLVIDPMDSTKLNRHTSGRTLAGSFEEVAENPFLVDIREIYDDDSGMVAFRLSNILSIDASFVLSLYDYIVDSASNAVSE